MAMKTNLKWVAGVLVGMSAFSCATTSPMGKNATPTVAGRFITSDGAAICMPERDSDARFEKFVDRLVEKGDWTHSMREDALRWSLVERRRAIVRAVVEAYTYGEVLKNDFDRLIQRGYTVERLSRRTSGGRPKYTVYSRLIALRALKNELIELAFDQLSADLEEYRRPDWSRDRLLGAVKVFLRKYREEIDTTVAQVNGDRDFLELALHELKNLAGDAERYYESCDPTVIGSTDADRVDLIARALQASRPVGAGIYKKFQPTREIVGFGIESLVKKEGVKEYLNFEISGRDPQAEAVYRPDTGSKGNIVGGAFPKGVWALTYDDGPAKTTPQILDHLKTHGVKATFFVLSKQLENSVFKAHALRAQSEGHAMASHSYTHAQIPNLGTVGREKEIQGALKVFEDVLGTKTSYFRLPYGAGVNVASVRQKIKEANLIHVFWNVDTLDWQDRDPQSILRRTVAQMKSAGNKGVILFHDIHAQSVIASELVMRHLKDPANEICAETLPAIVDKLNADAAGTPTPSLCP